MQHMGNLFVYISMPSFSQAHGAKGYLKELHKVSQELIEHLFVSEIELVFASVCFVFFM